MSNSPAHDCSEPLRQAFLELLRWTLLVIRNDCTDAKLCYAYADHMHNVPGLLAQFDTKRLAYYWEVERAGFLTKLAVEDQRPPHAFESSWAIVEGEYQRLCSPPTT